MRAYLERIESVRRLARFYVVSVQPTLLGEWAVIREWGRIGQSGTVRIEVYASEHAARTSADRLILGKVRRGYRARG